MEFNKNKNAKPSTLEASIGACGDNCSFCPRYIATTTNDSEMLREVRDLWVSLGWRESDVAEETLKCTGCSEDNHCAYETLRRCVAEKKLKTCGECTLYPCSVVKDVFVRTDALYTDFNAKTGCSQQMRISLEMAFSRKKENLDTIAVRSRQA